jgi:hypothetical protein
MFALILGSAAAMASLPASAAGATRTWVSGVGSDANPCSRTSPCQTFAAALANTAINGEINCIDPGGFGTVTITQSVTIDCTGNYASILAGSGTGVIVNIPTSPDDPHRSVRLRGLAINGTGLGTRTGIDGIRVVSASSVFVEDTVIGEFTQTGVKVATTSETVNLTLDNVTIRNINTNGVSMTTTKGQVVASFNNVRIDATSVAIAALGLARANVDNVMLVHNSTGIMTTGSDNIINVDNTKISYAKTGVKGLDGSTVRISNSVITQNETGLASGGSIVSMSGNSLTGNTTDGAFTGTVPKL